MPGIRDDEDVSQRDPLEVSGERFGIVICTRTEAIEHMYL